MRQDITDSSGHKRLAQLMIQMSEWATAKEIYESLMPKSDSNNFISMAFLHHQLGYIARQMRDLDETTALLHNIGSVQQEKDQIDETLQNYLQVSAIQDSYLPIIHPHRARTFVTSQTGKLYMHSDIRLIFARNKLDYDERTGGGQSQLVTTTEMPTSKY
ncbi:unnamed protein product [Rotaria sp. Silwood2]|nr:unnamed protein product [Rotaria sp. Silwood2]CAF3105257.1 unnamed protein product [Rotaria sp. Silwood2]CAF3487468.1 unnamed protein product [Rotaria sp. Silwood2]CAF4405190.1 unnamed protein product [Rotaria sp. Silwood2]CAF4458419.1 unnamed protein product [Rotaria sp. Silwood2]